MGMVSKSFNVIRQGLPRSFPFLCMLNFLIAAFIGLMMRYKMVFPLSFANQTYLLHAHSNFVFCGWVTLTLFSCMVTYMLPERPKYRSAYRVLFFLLEASSIGMLLTCLFQGYGLYSVIFIFLFIFGFYVFIVLFWRDYKIVNVPVEIKWFIHGAFILFVLSTLGPFLLGYYTLTLIGRPMIMRGILYWYLHFQYNGWFTFAVFALLLSWLHEKRLYPSSGKMKLVFVLLFIGVIPEYFLSIIGFYPYLWIRILSAFAVATHFVAGFILFLIVFKGYKTIPLIIPKETDLLWKIATAAYFLKIALQFGLLVPSLASFTFSFRPLIIGFLHLVFLCFISFFLIGFLLARHQLQVRSISVAQFGFVIFVIGVLVSEVLLFAQSFYGYISIYSPFFTPALFWTTAGLFIGLLLFVIGQKSSKEVVH